MTRSTPAPDLLVGDIIRHAARATPHELAASLGDDEMTFAELDARSNQVAHALAARGVGLGDRVAWWGETSLDAMPIFNALARLGAAFMPVNARLGADEAADVLEYAKPSLLIADAAHAALADGWDPPALTHAELFAAADREASTDDGAPAGLTEDATHVVFFTSGSTGRPKGVVLSHRTSWLRSFQGNLTDHTGGTVCMFPLFHMSGWSMTINAWQTRRPVHFAAPEPTALLSTAERRRATRLYHIPAVWQRVLEHDRSGYDLSTVQECDTGTSATPPELLTSIKDAFPGTVTRIFYGSTEVGLAAMLADADLSQKPGSVGPAAIGVSLALVDGEVCVRSPFLMDGYFEHPDANAEALAPIEPGGPPWYHTGDLGVLDDEGYLSIVGRARDVMRSGGETVAPAEVEAALATHPDIAEVAVVGLPDTEWGEIITAVVVVRAGGAMPTLDALRDHCGDRLARFKQPRRLEQVDALPRTAATGQIQRTLIVARLAGAAEPSDRGAGTLRRSEATHAADTTRSSTILTLASAGAVEDDAAPTGTTGGKRMGSKRFVSMVAVLGLVVGIGTTGVAFAGGHTKPDFSKLKPIKEPSPCKNDPGITDDTIKTGVLTIQSGPQGVTFAPSTEQGIKARIDEANSSGELGKRKIELVFKDDQANQANNLTAAQQLVEEEKVFGIIEQSNVADGSAKYLNQQKIPVAGWHIGQKEWGIYPNMFSWRNSQPPDATKEFTSRNADVMQALGAKKIAVVGTNVASGAIFLNQVAQAVQKTKGLKLVYKTTDVTPEQQDFTGIAAQIKDSGADGVYTAVAGLQANALSQALKQAGVKLKAIVFPGGYDDRILSLPGYDGAYFGTEFKPLEVGSPGLTKYENAMKADGFSPERFFAIQGYFGADAYVEGIKAAGVDCPTRKAFINNLRLQKGYDDGGAFIPVDRSESFGRIFYCVYYVQVQNKQFVPVFNGKPLCAKQLFQNGKARKLTKAEQARG